ncbi:hypothetical protein AX16_000382 [Volvariella volvacea WC 439]|nr:hypothetical protein AX16_000382 [Volvariella volvacea WC 439]
MLHEDGPQSSEDGSGLHSPVYDALTPSSDNLRYQGVQPTPTVLSPQYNYHQTLGLQQQIPIQATPLEPPNVGAQNVFPPQLSPSRNHLRYTFPIHPDHSRPLHHHTDGVTDFRYNAHSQRPLPGELSHDPTYPRATGNLTEIKAADYKPTSMQPAERSEPSTSTATSRSRESRKEISMVVIACRQCRSRKIRCDSTRPACHNCLRRSNPCEYDAVPKRRGPDKHPGTRKRTCKKRPPDGSEPTQKRRRLTVDQPPDSREFASAKAVSNMDGSGQSSSAPSRPTDRAEIPRVQVQQHLHPPVVVSPHQPTPMSYGYQAPSNIYASQTHFVSDLYAFPTPTSPTTEQSQRQWWDNWFRTYNLEDLVRNIEFICQECGHWLSFINIEFFIKTLYDEQQRLYIHPAFVYAVQALAALMSSNARIAYADAKRNSASFFFKQAQEQLEVAWAASRSNHDITLAEAALLLVLYEFSAHSEYQPARVQAKMVLLDNIITAMGLTLIDANDPDVARFPINGVPSLEINDYPQANRCSCIPIDSSGSDGVGATWSYPLPWDSSWDAKSIRDEECRRLCWVALSLISSHFAQCVVFNTQLPPLQLCDPGRYKLLFPGEYLDRLSPNYRNNTSISPKKSIWALYCRSMLLWNFATRVQQQSYSKEDKAEHAVAIMSEATAIQDALQLHHQCHGTIINVTSEYLHNTRLTVAQLYRSLHGLGRGQTNLGGPFFTPESATEWVRYQSRVIEGIKATINHTGSENQFFQRPFYTSWFITQLALCLIIWKRLNHQHVGALELAKDLLFIANQLIAMWPSNYWREQAASLRDQLTEACILMQLSPPYSMG